MVAGNNAIAAAAVLRTDETREMWEGPGELGYVLGLTEPSPSSTNTYNPYNPY